jgi:hypothetical protein
MKVFNNILSTLSRDHSFVVPPQTSKIRELVREYLINIISVIQVLIKNEGSVVGLLK